MRQLRILLRDHKIIAVFSVLMYKQHKHLDGFLQTFWNVNFNFYIYNRVFFQCKRSLHDMTIPQSDVVGHSRFDKSASLNERNSARVMLLQSPRQIATATSNAGDLRSSIAISRVVSGILSIRICRRKRLHKISWTSKPLIHSYPFIKTILTQRICKYKCI